MIVLVEVIIALIIGLWLTIFVITPFYESVGITVYGDVWVLWFAVAIFLYSIYTMIFSSIVKYPLKRRLRSNLFWFLFVVSILLIVIPFIQGEVPY
ncbi:hypothetical protein GMD78_10915 [Ornithinibacillus sp. L9]|uniref:Uncharacterized protein n=1 Tax=Ornithinibacillus caprae TaxID=2678566 RepID=A0A6N8FKQ6_9BACI|nr:hypothetical protein [Ornithinibacillus caprae]